MARTSAAHEASDATFTGATILPGVPLPTWGRPAEPVLPDPPPAPLPSPVDDGVPEPQPEPVLVGSAHAASDGAPVPDLAPETWAVATVAQFADLDAPIPQLAPATPVPPRAEIYAAAGAAPPTAPWGTPPATPPVEMAPAVEAFEEPVAVAEPSSPSDLDDAASLPAGSFADEPLPAIADTEHRHAGGDSGARRLLPILGVVGGVVVLGALAAFVWPGFMTSQDEPVAAPRPAASAPATVQLAAPDTVAGLTRISGRAADALTEAAAATTLSGYSAPVSAVYGTGTTPAATVFAWNATSRGTTADVSTAFAGYQSATGQPVTGIAPVATGKLGGRMSCGSSVVGRTPASVCFWTDDATFGAVTVLKPVDAKAGAATAVAIRTAMETRS